MKTKLDKMNDLVITIQNLKETIRMTHEKCLNIFEDDDISVLPNAVFMLQPKMDELFLWANMAENDLRPKIDALKGQ